MSFTGRLQVEFGDWGPKVGRMAQTISPITWESGDVLAVIPAGTISDGASVPRPLWWFLPPWGDEATICAVLHDYLCQRLDEGRPVLGCETRAKCDGQLRLALLAVGVAPWRAGIVWLAVRVGSLFHRVPDFAAAGAGE